jgi:hypothetical protein
MPRKWLESLSPEARARAEALIDELHTLGAPRPDAWAHHEVREGLPQLSRYLLLRHLWDEAIDAWRDSPLWMENLAEDARKGTEGPFADAAGAILRLLESGAAPSDLQTIARFVAYETVFSVLHGLDEGYDTDREGSLPGWALVERDPLGHVTGRHLDRLHVDLPSLDPSAEADEPGP